MHPPAYPVPAEKHDAQKGGLQEKGGEHFIAQQRPQHIAHLVGKHGPVGAELVGEHHTGNHPHAEGHGKNLDPHTIDLLVKGVAGFKPAPLHHGQPAG